MTPMRVVTTRPAKTTVLGYELPLGTIGKVIDYHFNGNPTPDLVIDFGLPTVCILPADSPLIEVDRSN